VVAVGRPHTCDDVLVRRLTSPARVLVPSVLLVAWMVPAQRWLANDSLGSSLIVGLLCAGGCAALVSLGVHRKAGRDGD